MRNQKGFTLIELLVVIAIIAILATLVITQVAGAQVRARNSSSQSDIAEAGKAVEVYKTDLNVDSVIIKNSNLTASAIPATNLNLTTSSGGWTTMFAGGTETATNYGTSISKTPSSSYTYGYVTDATGANYCMGTNAVNSNGVTAVGFIINNGSSKQAGNASGTVNYGTASSAATLPCS